MTDDDGGPATVWLLVVELYSDDSFGWVVERVFRGPSGFGEAQAYQRQIGGYIIEAHAWEREDDDS